MWFYKYMVLFIPIVSHASEPCSTLVRLIFELGEKRTTFSSMTPMATLRDLVTGRDLIARNIKKSELLTTWSEIEKAKNELIRGDNRAPQESRLAPSDHNPYSPPRAEALAVSAWRNFVSGESNERSITSLIEEYHRENHPSEMGAVINVFSEDPRILQVFLSESRMQNPLAFDAMVKEFKRSLFLPDFIRDAYLGTAVIGTLSVTLVGALVFCRAHARPDKPENSMTHLEKLCTSIFSN